MKYDLWSTPSGDLLYTHSAERCAGNPCCIHNPSDHVMREFPQHWRSDRALMERICPHGVGHPDPDDITYKRLIRGEEYAYYESIHGCDGCCGGWGGWTPDSPPPTVWEKITWVWFAVTEWVKSFFRR